MKNPSLATTLSAAAAILTGSFGFTGEAEAVTVLSETFEGDSNAFGMGTYNYSQGYTLPNDLTPGGGLKYAHGNTVAAETISATANPYSLLIAGITAADIDAGQVAYDLYAQFSTYRGDNDNASVRVTFLDEASAELSSVTIGGLAFTQALPVGVGLPERAWGADTLAGSIPTGARAVSFAVLESRLSGNASDGYVDNIRFDVNIVPEPATSALALWAAGGLLLRRKRVSRA